MIKHNNDKSITIQHEMTNSDGLLIVTLRKNKSVKMRIMTLDGLAELMTKESIFESKI